MSTEGSQLPTPAAEAGGPAGAKAHLEVAPRASAPVQPLCEEVTTVEGEAPVEVPPEARAVAQEIRGEVIRRVARWLIKHGKVVVTQATIEDVVKEVYEELYEGKLSTDDLFNITYAIAWCPPFYQLYDGFYSEEKLYVLLPKLRESREHVRRVVDAMRAVAEAVYSNTDEAEDIEAADAVVAWMLYHYFSPVSEKGEPRAWYYGRLMEDHGVSAKCVHALGATYCRVGSVWIHRKEYYCDVGAGICRSYEFASGKEVADALKKEEELKRGTPWEEEE